MPKEGLSYPRPSQILSATNLRRAWKSSKDAGGGAGSPGIDGVRARSYAMNLEENLRLLAKELRSGKFRFSALRPVFVPKPNSSKERIICIPSVKDRLVQRAVSNYLYSKKKFQVYNSSSFGFIPDLGLKMALQRALGLRSEFDFVFETDIVSFFNEIDRRKLIAKVTLALGKHSLVPIIESAINSEIKPKNNIQAKKLEAQNIRSGVGLRQGMPLSPVLSNLALSDFDREIERLGIPMVRYADDIVVFANSRTQAENYGKVVASELAKAGHKIPAIELNTKTKIAGKYDPLQFLGREIFFSELHGQYVQGVSDTQIKKILDKIRSNSSIEQLIYEGATFPDFSLAISRTLSAYLSSYRDAINYSRLESELRGAARGCVRQIYIDIFGFNKLKRVSSDHRKFLCIDDLDIDESESDEF